MTCPRQVAIRTLVLGVWAATIAAGQTVLNDPKKIADAEKFFHILQDKNSGCEVLSVRPHFIFSLRVQAGYLVRMPRAESEVPRQKWIVLSRIAPQAGNRNPVYLADVVHSPGDGMSQELEIEGVYSLGVGRYAVTFLMFDSRGEVCRKDWQIDARLSSGVSKFKPSLAPGTVEGSLGSDGVRAPGAKSIGHVTILLHAASVLQSQTLLGPLDKTMLLDGTIALMEELPVHSVRLVLFNLEQRRQLFCKDTFTLDALPEVAKALDAVQPAAVDYGAAQNTGGTANFIEKLVSQEIHASDPSNAVIFLGPKSIYRSKPSSKIDLPPGSKLRFFYLLCESTRFLLARSSTLSGGEWGAQGLAMGLPPRSSLGTAIPPADLPDSTVWSNYGPNHGADSIQYMVEELKGKTLQVDSPISFADAAAEITRLSRRKR